MSAALTSWQARRLRDCVDRGGIVAYPTEAVFGLGCDPLNPSAIERLLRIKQRAARRGLIVIASDVLQILPFMDVETIASLPLTEQMFASWPGPNTWVVPAAHWVPDLLTGGRNNIAVRVTANPQAAAVCDALGGALVSTSANRSGAPPCRSALAVRSRFGRSIDMLLPGATPTNAAPSQIRDLVSGAVLRASAPMPNGDPATR